MNKSQKIDGVNIIQTYEIKISLINKKLPKNIKLKGKMHHLPIGMIKPQRNSTGMKNIDFHCLT